MNQELVMLECLRDTNNETNIHTKKEKECNNRIEMAMGVLGDTKILMMI